MKTKIKINRYIVIFGGFALFELFKLFPPFRIKLAPFAIATAGISFFRESFINNGIYLFVAIMIALIIAIAASMLKSRKEKPDSDSTSVLLKDKPELKLSFFPKTRTGKWAVWLIIILSCNRQVAVNVDAKVTFDSHIVR